MAKRLKRSGLLAVMTVLSLNVWTGSPLAALSTSPIDQRSGRA